MKKPKPKSSQIQLFLNIKCHTGIRKVHKKCHVLFEWPITAGKSKVFEEINIRLLYDLTIVIFKHPPLQLLHSFALKYNSFIFLAIYFLSTSSGSNKMQIAVLNEIQNLQFLLKTFCLSFQKKSWKQLMRAHNFFNCLLNFLYLKIH